VWAIGRRNLDTSLIYQALEQPSLRKQIPLAELERIQAAYPYFTAAQVLLAKIYQENKDHRYADQLQQAALYAIDRKVLSEYMRESEEETIQNGKQNENENELSRETGQNENEKQNENENELRGETGQNENEKQPIRQAQGPNENELRGRNESEKEDISGEYVFITDEELSIFEGKAIQNENEKRNENELREETIQNENEKRNENELRGESEEEIPIEGKSARVEMSDFDRQLLIEAVHSSIEMEVGEGNQNENEKLNENELRGESVQNGNEKLNENELRGESVQNGKQNELRGESEEEIRRIEAKDPAELTFGELMMLKAARMGTMQNENEKRNENELRGEDEVEDEEIRLSANEERTEERGKNFDYLYKLHNGGLAPIDAPNEKEKQKSIIDRFIKLEPKITPGKVSEYNTASNLAKESLEEDFSFATETMAKLFIAQGKFDKAKKVYRKLMELHPEKNVYFAAQLKNLNQNKKQ
jgi:hypothetical protein